MLIIISVERAVRTVWGVWAVWAVWVAHSVVKQQSLC
jgi:hypothetical protein